LKKTNSKIEFKTFKPIALPVSVIVYWQCEPSFLVSRLNRVSKTDYQFVTVVCVTIVPDLTAQCHIDKDLPSS